MQIPKKYENFSWQVKNGETDLIEDSDNGSILHEENTNISYTSFNESLPGINQMECQNHLFILKAN